MKKYYIIALSVLAFSFTACGGDEETTPAPPTTDEIIGTYTGSELSLLKFSDATDDEMPDETTTEPNMKIVIAKGANGYTLAIDDNDNATPPAPISLIIQDVLIAGNGTTFRIPAQEYTVDGETTQIEGNASFLNGTTPADGLYTRNDKTLRFEFDGIIDTEDDNGDPIEVELEVEYNVNKK
jgi:hypothetical protein